MKIAFTSDVYAGVFPCYNKVRNRWEMLDARCENMICLFDTEAQALDFKAISLRQLIDREQSEIKRAAEKAKHEQEYATYLSSFRGFLHENPMRRGKQLATLERKFFHRGVIRTRKEIVELLIGEGRTVTENGLEAADGAFMSLTQTERAYAEHIISQQAEDLTCKC
jgi:hypothetical protein